MSESNSSDTVKFNGGRKRRNLRARRRSSEDEDDVELSEKVELHKELRKMREKQHGVSSISLAIGKNPTKEESLVMDPFKREGGMVDMELLKNSVANDDAYDIGTQFSKETNTRDEEAEMLKYIDNELQKRKTDQVVDSGVVKFLSPEEAAMQAVPEHLRTSGTHKSEEMLSFQMLNGIPEIDLGIEVKIKNIEATEEAKQKILLERLRKKEGPSVFVPTNMAVNFVQHNRFNIEEPAKGQQREKRKAPEPEKKKVVVVGAEPEEQVEGGVVNSKEKGDKATDDFHFEKFKKQFRRY